MIFYFRFIYYFFARSFYILMFLGYLLLLALVEILAKPKAIWSWFIIYGIISMLSTYLGAYVLQQKAFFRHFKAVAKEITFYLLTSGLLKIVAIFCLAINEYLYGEAARFVGLFELVWSLSLLLIMEFCLARSYINNSYQLKEGAKNFLYFWILNLIIIIASIPYGYMSLNYKPSLTPLPEIIQDCLIYNEVCD